MTFPSIRLEGAILTADLLDAIAREEKHSQKPADFGLDPSTKVKDEIASTWASAKALWTGYQAKIANLHEGQSGVSETRNLFIIPLLALLGYQPEKAEAETVNGKSYAISHRDISRDSFPLHIMGWHDSLEKKRDTGGPRVSAHALVQEYLNLTEHSYGIITNGRQLRLLRDSSRLIKLSFLEFDLNRIFEEDLYADFAILFRLLHATRMPANRTHASASVIEKYHQDSVDSGSRIRDGLAAAVAYAMQTVANGLLAPGVNPELLDQLRKDPARANELHQNLLRWVYRTLFVLVIEERGLNHAPAATLRQRQLYRDYYSLQRLRRLADRPQLADRRAHDLWRAMHQTLRLYEDGGKGLPLGIPPLGSFLFREAGLHALFQYQLDNRSLLLALNRLSTFTHPDTQVRMRVNYGALDVEEFGSVYESLLELRPRIIPDGEKLTFNYAQLAGNERKTTGSYYTPDSLVQCLLDSALDPVVEERLANARESFEASTKGGKGGRPQGPPSPPSEGGEGRGEVGSKSLREALEKALLSIKVCDPAVGSGHFLIGAAHRLAQRLAEIRAGEEALSPDVQRHALRDVVSHCLYGVDINPLSVELCKVSLWMLAMEPGKPLGFLDHHIQCGNSLLGATPALIKGGIPDDAYKPIEGDEPAACTALKRQNRRDNPQLGDWFLADEAVIRDKLYHAATAIDDIQDDRPEDIQRKESAFRNVQTNYEFLKARELADLWCAAFVIKKHFPGSASEISNLKSEAVASLDTQPLATQGGLFGGTEELSAPKAKGRKSSTLNPPPSTTPIGITTQHLRAFAEGSALPDGLLPETRRLRDQYQFFHWHLAFPEVAKHGGFNVILGNPPWDVVEFKEGEWFSSWNHDIAEANTKALRHRMIEGLRVNDPALFTRFEDARRQVDAFNQFLNNSGAYPLCAAGKINLSSAFSELALNKVATDGRSGLIVPSGIASDRTTKLYFQHLIDDGLLVTLYDFENRLCLFSGVDSRMKFCLLTACGRGSRQRGAAEFAFFAHSVDDLRDPTRRFTLTPEDIVLLNPNTRTCPIFRSRRDAEVTKQICRRVPVLLKDSDGPAGDMWACRIRQNFFSSTIDSHLFRQREDLEKCGAVLRGNSFVSTDGAVFAPLYEAKMVHHFDSRWSTYSTPSEAVDLQTTERNSPHFSPLPRFWVPAGELTTRLNAFSPSSWLVGWRDITNGTNERTSIFAVFPRVAANDTLSLFYTQQSPGTIAGFVACMSSFALDYACRQKIAGTHLKYHYLKQLPVLPPSTYAEPCAWAGQPAVTLRDWLLPRVLELTYTAWDLEPFARDCGWSGPPFVWDEARRFQLRCELDAAFLHLYGLNRDDTAYILDTFPIVKRKDEARTAEKNAAGEVIKPGRYITKDTILEIYDALADSTQTGQPYQTRLDPPPADPRCCHPPKQATVPVMGDPARGPES